MSITLKNAIANGDLKQKSIKSTLITQKLKTVLKNAYTSDKNTCVLSISEINNAVLKISDETEVLEMFTTNDKSLFDKNGDLKQLALLKIRLTDLVNNSLKNSIKNGFLIARTQHNSEQMYYYNEVENVHETVQKATKTKSK